MAAAVTGTPDGLLVGGVPAAILAASSALHEVAFRTDDVGVSLARALGPAATTVAAAAPFLPAQARAVAGALDAVAASPRAGLATVAAAYEAASLQMRLAGQALELAGVAAVVGAGGLALARGGRPTILSSANGLDLRREAMSGGLSVEAVGLNGTVSTRLVERPDGTTFYVVEMTTAPKVASSAGAQVNGVGAFGEAATGVEKTQRWAVASREDATKVVAVLVGAAALLPVAGSTPLAALPPPTEVTMGTSSSLTAVGGTYPAPTSGSGSLTVRSEVTRLSGGGERLGVSISGAGQAALVGVVGTGGAAGLRLGLERDRHGQLTQVTVARSEEVDRGRHGLPLLEAGNREATLVEREWTLELTPENRAPAERVAAAVAAGRPPEAGDVAALSRAAANVDPEVRTYDVRHQLASADVSGEVGLGGSLGMDTATLRQPPAPPVQAGPPPPDAV
ncbi:MAG: hypothetical protein ABIS47_04770 [Acidimicrobiales bacterium]